MMEHESEYQTKPTIPDLNEIEEIDIMSIIPIFITVAILYIISGIMLIFEIIWAKMILKNE